MMTFLWVTLKQKLMIAIPDLSLSHVKSDKTLAVVQATRSAYDQR